MIYDILIKNGKIVNGAGNPWYRADIGVKDGKILKIRSKLRGDAKKEINAMGLIVCPGFIDIHSHTDFAMPMAPPTTYKVESTIHQGITTNILGMCGQSLAPVTDERMEDFRKIFSGFIPEDFDLDISWRTFGEYMAEIEKRKCAANSVCVVGYENIRVAGGAGFENRLPTSEELESMKDYISEAMESGAFGMSTGLIYAPQLFSKTDELIELAKVVAKYNGLYFSHIRSEGETLIESVKEFIEIVEKSGCIGGQMAHHKVAGKNFWGASKDSLRLIEEANARGINVTFDQYPYNRGMSGLVTTLPPWAREGGVNKVLERLNNDEDRKRIKKDIETGIKGYESWIKESGFESIYISMIKAKEWKDIEGKSISEITRIKGKKDDWETFFDLLVDGKCEVAITIQSMGEEDIRRIMTSRYHMVGTDGAGIPNIPQLGVVHPHFYGTYPRILGKYVREEGLLTLEDAIRRMTSFPAQRLGLRDRGLLREGNWADIVLFDPNTIIDKATFTEPHQYPEGISHVFVNGMLVIKDNKQLKKRPGKVLRRPT